MIAAPFVNAAGNVRRDSTRSARRTTAGRLELGECGVIHAGCTADRDVTRNRGGVNPARKLPDGPARTRPTITHTAQPWGEKSYQPGRFHRQTRLNATTVSDGLSVLFRSGAASAHEDAAPSDWRHD
jgi:hypothetical protein